MSRPSLRGYGKLPRSEADTLVRAYMRAYQRDRRAAQKLRDQERADARAAKLVAWQRS